MLERKWTYFDVLEREGDEQRAVVLNDAAVEGQVEARNGERHDGAVLLVRDHRREVFDVNA